MNTTSLQHKTVRPGSLNGYSYYYSSRQPARAAAAKPAKTPKSRRKLWFTVLLLAIIAAPVVSYRAESGKTPSSAPASQEASAAAATVATSVNRCASNPLEKHIQIDLSDRHLWACEGSREVHDAPVITGMSAHASTITPTGTYKIYAKQADTTLKGTDETGSWNDPVYYWMPFLTNQYGTYGFHDATWRADNEFGKIDPTSSDASHGCVELPLSDSQWLYEWATTGTPLTIES